MKKISMLLLSLMLANSAFAGGVGGALSALEAVGNLSKNGNASVTAGIVDDSQIHAKATAKGKDSEAMAGGVVSATPGGDGAKMKITFGSITKSKVHATADASGGGKAYAGAVVSK